MTSLPWLLPCAFFAAGLLILLVIAAAIVGAVLWLDRSPSPRAARLRHLLGGRERRVANAKRFFWTGEDRAFRHAAAKDLASRRGLSCAATDLALLPLLRPFGTVVRQTASAIEDVICWEDDERKFTLAAYTYEDSESSTTNALLYVDASALQLPPFFITGETAAHKVLFSARDIDFADDAEFSSRYHLESSDEPAVRELFTGEVRAAFVATGNCRIECVASRLVFVDDQQTSVAGLTTFVDDSTRLMDAITKRWRSVRRFRRD